MFTFGTASELQHALGRSLVIVFIWVAWAMYAHRSRDVAVQMIDRWNCEHPNQKTELVQVDLTEQLGEMWGAVSEWLNSQTVSKATALMYGGAGPVLWGRNGTVANCTINANAEALDGLLDLTATSFDVQLEGNAK